MIVNLYNPSRFAQAELQGTFIYAIKVIDKTLENYFDVIRVHRDRYMGNALNILINDTGLAIHGRMLADVWWADTILFPFHYAFVPAEINGLFRKNYVLSRYVKEKLNNIGVRVDGIVQYPIDDVLFYYWKPYDKRKYDVAFLGKSYPYDRKNVKLAYEIFNELGVKALMITNEKLKPTRYVEIFNATSVSEKMKGKILSSAKVFFFPSKSEGMGIPVLEAMATGTPVIYTKGHGTEDFAYGIGVSPISRRYTFSNTGVAEMYIYGKEELKEALLTVIDMDKEEWTDFSIRTKSKALERFKIILEGMRKILNTPKSEFNTLRLYELREVLENANG